MNRRGRLAKDAVLRHGGGGGYRLSDAARPLDPSGHNGSRPAGGFPVVPRRFFESRPVRSSEDRLNRLFEPVRSIRTCTAQKRALCGTRRAPVVPRGTLSRPPKPQKVAFEETDAAYAESITWRFNWCVHCATSATYRHEEVPWKSAKRPRIVVSWNSNVVGFVKLLWDISNIEKQDEIKYLA